MVRTMLPGWKLCARTEQLSIAITKVQRLGIKFRWRIIALSVIGFVRWGRVFEINILTAGLNRIIPNARSNANHAGFWYGIGTWTCDACGFVSRQEIIEVLGNYASTVSGIPEFIRLNRSKVLYIR